MKTSVNDYKEAFDYLEKLLSSSIIPEPQLDGVRKAIKAVEAGTLRTRKNSPALLRLVFSINCSWLTNKDGPADLDRLSIFTEEAVKFANQHFGGHSEMGGALCWVTRQTGPISHEIEVIVAPIYERSRTRKDGTPGRTVWEFSPSKAVADFCEERSTRAFLASLQAAWLARFVDVDHRLEEDQHAQEQASLKLLETLGRYASRREMRCYLLAALVNELISQNRGLRAACEAEQDHLIQQIVAAISEIDERGYAELRRDPRYTIVRPVLDAIATCVGHLEAKHREEMRGNSARALAIIKQQGLAIKELGGGLRPHDES